MRERLENGTELEVVRIAGSTRGLVVAPDIFGLRPLFDDLVQRFADQWNMTTIAVEPFPTESLTADIEPRYEAVSRLTDDRVLGDLFAAADLTGCDEVSLVGFCLGGMHCFKAADQGRFDRIASFYGMIRLPEAWNGPGQSEPLPHVARHQTPFWPLLVTLIRIPRQMQCQTLKPLAPRSSGIPMRNMGLLTTQAVLITEPTMQRTRSLEWASGYAGDNAEER